MLATIAVLALGVGLIATQASAHIERASYWPDPAPDTSVSPPAGGKVPAARSLFTALRKKPAGTTRVVCQGKVPSRKRIKKTRRKLRAARRKGASRKRIRALKRKLRAAKRRYKRGVRRNASIRRLRRAIRKAYKSGYKYRPSEKSRKLSRKQGKRLLRFNERLLARCKFRAIQDAVTKSRNNDRVVIMPGVYSEPKSRKKPNLDPKCKKHEILNDEGESEALSYAYQVTCPNAQNLIAVIGRALGPGSDPKEPRWDRHGIPNLGRCIRCNLQMEGSSPNPDDVVVDAGRVASGNGAPIGHVKDVGIRADRADGFVLRNITVRHAGEHNIYILEADGYLVERFKAFYGGEYGVLTFVADHGVMQDCEAVGHGDAGLYPGAAPETGQETIEKRRRYNQQIRRCDMHHNAQGMSSTTGNAVWVHHNNIYDNAMGGTTDVITASGHPGFPQDSSLYERNRIYSNNFNPYAKDSDVEPTLPLPVGSGFMILGGNNNTVRNNHFYDNWRRAVLLITVPDAFVCGDNPVASNNHQKGCKEDGSLSTSFDNRFYGNVMGRDPSGKRDPNDTDFWWDNFVNQQDHNPPTTTGNCWFDNIGRDGTERSITSFPSPLPSNCALSLATGGPEQERELLTCLAAYDDEVPDIGPCDWYTIPSEPK